MLSNRYTKEYRADTVTDAKGKVRDRFVYVGPLYRFDVTQNKKKRARVLMAVYALASAALFVSSLWNFSVLGRVAYVIVPYSCLAVVVYLFASSAVYLLLAGDTLNREQKEKTVDRMKGSGVAGMALAGVSLAGAGVFFLGAGVTPGVWDVYLLAADLLLLLFAFLVFCLGTGLPVEEVKNPGRA